MTWAPSRLGAELEDAIEQLYRVFARYPLRRHIDACPCCVTDAHRASLYGAPLRELMVDELQPFASKALSTFGDDHDFRHFLPRILELAARVPRHFGCELENAVAKLSEARWTEWPSAEREAVERFLDAWWLDVLGDERHQATEALSAILLTGRPLAPLLARWEEHLDRSAVARAALLTMIYAASHPEPLDHRVPTTDVHALIRWLAAPERMEAIERGITEDIPGSRGWHEGALEALWLRARTL